jgi:hypothetical protein
MFKLQAKDAQAVQSGDYFQVSFDEEEDRGISYDTGKAYFLIQRQFEFPDQGKCYIESRDMNYVGHYKVKSAKLVQNKFYVEIYRKEHNKIEISFRTSNHDFKEMQRILKIMIPEVVIDLGIENK